MDLSTTQLRTAHEMGIPYESIAPAIRNRNRVIITDDRGQSESIILNIAEYDAMKEAAWERYALDALAEVEAIKDDPSTWISLEEFWQS